MIVKKEAELERFFEKDIVEFLDKQTKINTSKDELKKIEDAILSKNFTLASTIIEDAVKKFNKTNTNDVYREINFTKIRDLVQTAENLTKNITHKNRLSEDIKLLKESGQLTQDHTQNITVLDERDRNEALAESEIEREQMLKAKNIENKIAEINKQLFVSIRKKDLKGAIGQYREIKNKFKEYPSMFSDEKKEIYSDLMAFYMRINKLKEELKNTKTEGLNLQKPQLTERNMTINDVKNIINEIKKDITSENFKEAKTKIINFKHKISLIPETYINIKRHLENTTNILLKKTEFYKKNQNLTEKEVQNESETHA
ncbi:MAG: hypothetical protein ACLFN8_00410 [Candidatus Woesearchaeota archaeon]